MPLEGRLGRTIREPGEHANAVRLCKRLGRHRDELTGFRWKQELDGSNTAAERPLRPAVVMHKITGGSRSQARAAAWRTPASLIRTSDQRNLGGFDATKKPVMDYWAQRRP